MLAFLFLPVPVTFFSLQAFGAFPNTGISHPSQVLSCWAYKTSIGTGTKKKGHHLHGLQKLFRLGDPPIYNYPEVDRIWDVQSYTNFDWECKLNFPYLLQDNYISIIYLCLPFDEAWLALLVFFLAIKPFETYWNLHFNDFHWGFPMLELIDLWAGQPMMYPRADLSFAENFLCLEDLVVVCLVSYFSHDPMTHMLYGIFTNICPTFCGWLRHPAPVENGGKHPIVGFQASQVVQDFFFQPQYVSTTGMIQIDYPLVNSHIAMENHHAINGKIHYFYGHVQWLFVCSPEGNKIKLI